MSYTIEYNRIIYKIPQENGESKLMLVIKQGDNNVWNPYKDMRSRHWWIVNCATEKNLWKDEIMYRAGATCGGSLQRAVGWSDTRYFTIEEYVKLYRSKVRNAKPIERFFNEDFDVTYKIHVNKDKDPSAEVKELFEQYDFEQKEDWYSNHTFIAKMNTLDEFLSLLEHENRKCGHFVLQCRKRRI